MTTVCVVQARMGSSRLPGKVLKDLTPGETVLERVVTRLRRAATIDRIVVATTVDPADDAIAAACKAYGVDCTRGDTFDVLDRFVQTVRSCDAADVVVRVTADCPFVDPEVVDEVVTTLRDGGYDFVANRLPPPYRRTYPVGLDVEACTASALEEAWASTQEPHHREHVMPFLYEAGSDYSIRVIDLPEDYSGHRWTIDTPEDLTVARAIAAALGAEPFGWRAVLAATLADSSLEEANAGQSQKHVTEIDHRR